MASLSLKDKIPPHNIEAEQATLGALLLDWDVLGDIVSILTPDRFYSLQNQKIFKAMLDLYKKDQRGDIMTVVEQLRTDGELDAAGGPSYISSLTNKVPTSANIVYYATIVKEQAIRRDVLKLAANMIATAQDETVESRSALEIAQQQIYELTDTSQTTSYKQAKDLIGKAIEIIETIYHNKAAFTGVESGLVDLDTMTSGFQPSELIIIGARPSIGKTALALSMAQNIAINNKISTAFFSLEMSDMQLIQRLLSQEARIRADSIRTGKLTTQDFQMLQNAAGKIYEAPLYIVDSPNMKLLDLRAMARNLKTLHDIKIVFIDYITLIESENKTLPRHEQIAEISRSLKSLARELQIPIVVLSQVRRDSEGKQPTLADLRESGSIEQDADVVMFLHRDRDAKEVNQPQTTELILAKQRNGPTGTVKIQFIPYYTRYENLSHQNDNH